MNYLEVLDHMYYQIDWRIDNLSKISDDLDFLSGLSINSLDEENLKQLNPDLALTYHSNLNAAATSRH